MFSITLMNLKEKDIKSEGIIPTSWGVSASVSWLQFVLIEMGTVQDLCGS